MRCAPGFQLRAETDSFKHSRRKPSLEDIGSRGMQILRESFGNWGETLSFFLMEKKLRSISLRKERKGIKKGIFSLKKSAIYTGGGEF